MNWHKQMEDILAGWTETQRRVWDQWMDAVKGMAPGAEHVQAQYHQQLDAWEQSVRQALDRQKEWAESLQSQGGTSAPQQEMLEQWMGQVQQAMQGWTEAQSQLWSSWMENMRRMEASSGDMPWRSGGEEVMKAWQQAAEQAQQTMQQWAETTGGAGTGAGSGGSGGTKSGGSGGGKSGGSGGGKSGGGKSAS